MGIREVADRSGVSASALRYYETIGLIPPPSRTSNRRQYEPSVLDRLVVITTARRAGFTLAEVRELLDGMSAGRDVSEAWRAMASRKLPEVDSLIESFIAVRKLLQAVASCQCVDLTQCASLLRGCAGATRGDHQLSTY